MTKRLFQFINLILMLTVLCAAADARADATTTNKFYDLMTTGSNRGQWGINLNNNFNIIDKNLGGYISVDVAGSSNITVSAGNAQYIYHRLTGILTGNIQYVLPATSGIYIIDNQTTGSYTLKVDNMLGGTGVTVAQGSVNIVYNDATNSKVIAANNTISGILASASGGTNSAYFAATGPTVARTFTFPDANATVLTSNAPVTVAQGGSGVATLAAHGVLIGNGTSNVVVSSAGTSGYVLTSNGASLDPTYQAVPAATQATTSDAGIVQLATNADLQTGTSNTLAVTPAALKSGIGVSKTYKSAQTAFTYSTVYTLAHGLGGLPYEAQINLVCISPDNGYSVGDVVYNITTSVDNTGSGVAVRGLGVSADATNLYVSVGNAVNWFTKSGGGQNGFTVSKWAFVVIARI